MKMSNDISWMSLAALLLLAVSVFSPSVECSRAEISRKLKAAENSPSFRPPNDAEIADFEAWVSREGKRAQLKRESAAAQQEKESTVEASSSSLHGESSKDVQTYIVVDQNGNGQFSKVQDAIDSIEKDQQRTTRITIQINPGYYKYVLSLPSSVTSFVVFIALPLARSPAKIHRHRGS